LVDVERERLRERRRVTRAAVAAVPVARLVAPAAQLKPDGLQLSVRAGEVDLVAERAGGLRLERLARQVAGLRLDERVVDRVAAGAAESNV
jgi:hypothetical protein